MRIIVLFDEDEADADADADALAAASLLVHEPLSDAELSAVEKIRQRKVPLFEILFMYQHPKPCALSQQAVFLN